MSLTHKWHSLFKSESCGSRGSFGLEILTACSPILPNLRDPRITSACYEAERLLSKAIRTVAIESDPEEVANAASERETLLSCFPEPIFVEPIPNGYCPDWCCSLRPWFLVTTKVGRFKIGWRKSVMHLEWTEVPNTLLSEKLFPDENVTRFDRVIHAHSLAKAKLYVQRVMEDAQSPAKPTQEEY